MTNAEIEEIEQRHARLRETFPHWAAPPPGSSDVERLIAEVRRLREMMKDTVSDALAATCDDIPFLEQVDEVCGTDFADTRRKSDAMHARIEAEQRRRDRR